MRNASRRRQVIILKLEVTTTNGNYLPFEMRLPSETKRITGIVVTNNANDGTGDRVGVLTLQSQDESDVFLQMDVQQDSPQPFAPPYVSLFDGDNDPAMMAGKMRRHFEIEVDGKAGSINGWYKTDLGINHSVTIYLEYELF